MKIVLCNKYFFLNGGTEKYLRDVMHCFASTGHEPVPFSVSYAGNWQSPYSHLFLPPPGDEHQTRFEHIRLRPAGIIRHLDRSIYSVEARLYLTRLLREIGGADVAYLLNIYNYMSPSVIHTLKKFRIPVVLQIGDYNLLCPSYLFLRQGMPCTLCARGSYVPALRYRCVKENLWLSAVRVFAMLVHRLLHIYDLVDAFVVPSAFMRDRLLEGGFSPERLHLIAYPVSGPAARRSEKRNYILYFGRIIYEKGLDILIHAFQQLPAGPELVLIGRSYSGERERLEKLIYSNCRSRIRFLDFMEGEELSRWIEEALVSVVPSRWPDNAPLSVYESFMHGTPVLGANIGALSEQIQNGVTGMLFCPGSVNDLGAKLALMLESRERLIDMGNAAKEYAVREHSMQNHMARLLLLFESVRENARV
jgi:glycosyltransferase involved in cell wall biosynthesis